MQPAMVSSVWIYKRRVTCSRCIYSSSMQLCLPFDSEEVSEHDAGSSTGHEYQVKHRKTVINWARPLIRYKHEYSHNSPPTTVRYISLRNANNLWVEKMCIPSLVQCVKLVSDRGLGGWSSHIPSPRSDTNLLYDKARAVCYSDRTVPRCNIVLKSSVSSQGVNWLSACSMNRVWNAHMKRQSQWTVRRKAAIRMISQDCNEIKAERCITQRSTHVCIPSIRPPSQGSLIQFFSIFFDMLANRNCSHKFMAERQ